MAKKTGNKKGFTDSGLKTVLFAAILTFVIGIFVVAKYSDRLLGPGSQQEPSVSVSRNVDLYLSGEDGLMLKAMSRNIAKGPLENELGEALAALIADPSSTIPTGTRLLGVKVTGEVAFIDFSSEIIKNHTGGSSGETQTIYSIVDTVTLNFPEVKKVQLLVEGRTEQTLAGHIDISMPLPPDMDIISK